MNMIVVVGNIPNGFLVEDLNVKVPFRAQVQFTLPQYHRSDDLKAAIRGEAVRVLYGAPPVTPVHPTPTPQVIVQPPLLAEGVASGFDKMAPLVALVEAQQAQLEVYREQTRLMAVQSAQIEQLTTLLTSLHAQGGPATPTATRVSTAYTTSHVEQDTPVFIPTPKKVEIGEQQVQVDQSTSGSVGGAVNALRKLNRAKS